jgi:4-alpha-glucanotransferase
MRRGSGILLHVSSLPSPFGIGDLGPEAYKFVDFLTESKQTYWQILPLNPTDPSTNNSPYRSSSAFAGNPLFVSPEILVEQGLLGSKALERLPGLPEQKVDYPGAANYKNEFFDIAFKNFQKDGALTRECERFCQQHHAWLEDFALFRSLKRHFREIPWSEWPVEIRDRQPEAIKKITTEFSKELEKEKFLQFVFFSQWNDLKTYCNQRGIHLIGDAPIYVACESAEVWTHPELFKLDADKKPRFVAGVPPDYFSETGQLWGDPVYDWEAQKQSDYSWWARRIEHNLKLVDILRIDHFRGLAAYWEIPAGEKTAVNGKWVEGPGEHFFQTLLKRFIHLPIIAEDLGVITPDVRELIGRFDFPGMKVLLFAFDESLPRNPYALHNHVVNSIVYTGTHDNNTVRGWFENEVSPDTPKRLFSYLGRETAAADLPWEFIRLAMMSVALIAIIPVQDLLGLGREARMNQPAVQEGNWEWRLRPGQLTPDSTSKLSEMTCIFGRD